MSKSDFDWYECKWAFWDYLPRLQSLKWSCEWALAAESDLFHPLYFPEREEELKAEIGGDRVALIELKPGLIELASPSPSPQIRLSDGSLIRWPNHRWRTIIGNVRSEYAVVMKLQDELEEWICRLRPYWDSDDNPLFESWGYKALTELQAIRAMIGSAQDPIDFGPTPTFQPGDELLAEPNRYGDFLGERGDRIIAKTEALRDEVDVALNLIIRSEHDRLLHDAKRVGIERKEQDEHGSQDDGWSIAADATTIISGDKRYVFAKGQQSAAVRALWDANGHSLKQETIGDKADSTANRFELRKVFRLRDPVSGKYTMHPAWGELIQSDGKGCYRLVRPE